MKCENPYVKCSTRVRRFNVPRIQLDGKAYTMCGPCMNYYIEENRKKYAER